jgi:hypothetical protein
VVFIEREGLLADLEEEAFAEFEQELPQMVDEGYGGGWWLWVGLVELARSLQGACR